MENNKPITLLREDFMNGIAVLVNQSGLPLFVVEDCLRQLLNGVSELARQQLEHDRQEYQMMMTSQNENIEKVTGNIVEE